MATRKAFEDIYRYLQKVIAPALKYSQYLYEDVLKFYITSETEWLDLGCGQRLLPHWRLNEEENLIGKCKSIVGIDRDAYSLIGNKSIFIKIMGDIIELPFKNESFNMVTANMVVEHLDNPEVQFREINRVLRVGGIFIFHTPNVFSYSVMLGRIVPDILMDKLAYILQGRKNVDIFDTFYRANSRKRITYLAQKNGFEVLKMKMIVSSAIFAIIPPLALIELVWIRILMMKKFKPFRTNIIAVLKKQ